MRRCWCRPVKEMRIRWHIFQVLFRLNELMNAHNVQISDTVANTLVLVCLNPNPLTSFPVYYHILFDYNIT
jgi:hypothetical protein